MLEGVGKWQRGSGNVRRRRKVKAKKAACAWKAGAQELYSLSGRGVGQNVAPYPPALLVAVVRSVRERNNERGKAGGERAWAPPTQKW